VQAEQESARQLESLARERRVQQVLPASAQLPLAAEQQEQPLASRALARQVLPGAVEPLWPLLLSHPCPP
jgi:hypothetical protein